METTIEQLEGSKKKLTIEIDAAEIDSRINKQYKDFAYRYNFPGFRKGKAPRPIVDSMLGADAVRATVTDDILNKVTPLAIDENDLVLVGQVEFEESEEMVEAGKPFVYRVTVETRPEYELSSYDVLKVELPSTDATEEEIDDQINELLNYYYDFEDADSDQAVEENGFVEIALSAVDENGNELESLNSESRLYELGMGLFPKEFDEALVGLKQGQKAQVEISPDSPSMLTRGVAEDAGKIVFDIEVKQVKKRIVPELNDEWAKEKAGFESVADLRNRMGEQIKTQKESVMPRIRENEALYALQERLEGEVPAAILEAQEMELMQNFFTQLQQSGMSFDMFLMQQGMSPDTFKDDLKRQAKDISVQDLALDAWARHFELSVGDEDITKEFAASGAEDPAALEEEWRAAGRMAALRAGMKRTLAINDIMEKMEVSELPAGEKLRSVREREAQIEAERKEAEAAKKAEKDSDKADKGETEADKEAEPAADEKAE